MKKPTKRKAFNFLRSYFDVLNELEKPEDKLDFLMSIINKQFLNEDPKELNFLVNLCYESQRHQIESSVKGWERARNETLETTPPTPSGTTPPTPKQEEEVQEEEKEEYTNKNNFDFDVYLENINKLFGKKLRVVNDKAKRSIKARLKEGYEKIDIWNAMQNCKNDQFHKESNYKYCTPQYFAQVKTLDMHGGELKKVNNTYQLHD